MTSDPRSAPPRPRARQWLLNVAAGYADLAVGGAIFILLTPLFVKHLGVEGYAAWVLSHTVTFYLQFLDLGFGEAQTRLHAKFGAMQKQQRLERLFGTVAASLSIGGLIAAAVGTALAFAPLDQWLEVSPSLAGDLCAVVAILAINVSIALPASTLRNFYEGAQRFDIQNLQSIALRVTTAAAQLLLLRAGYGLVELAAVELAATCMGVIVDLILIHRLMPGLLSIPIGFHRQMWRRIRTFACWASIDDLIAEGSSRLDEILIAALLPLALLTPYALCLALGNVVTVAVRPLTETFFPMAAMLHTQRRNDKLARLLLLGTKVTTAIATPLTIVLIFFGDAVLRIWVPEVTESTGGALVPLVVLSSLFSAYLWTSSVLLLALNRVRLLAMLTLVEVAVEIALIAVLAPRMGLEGVALAALIANVSVGALLELPFVCRIANVRVSALAFAAIGRLLLVSVPAVVAAIAFKFLHFEREPLLLLTAVAVVGAIYLASLVLFGSNARERAEILGMWRMLRREEAIHEGAP